MPVGCGRRSPGRRDPRGRQYYWATGKQPTPPEDKDTDLSLLREGKITITPPSQEPAAKDLVGVDIFLDWSDHGRDADVLGKGLEEAQSPLWKLTMITNRGVKVYPQGLPETFNTDHWRCRFVPANGQQASYKDIITLLTLLTGHGYEIIKTENLYTFNGERGYSQAQGE